MEIVLATRNLGKVAEFERLLAELHAGIHVRGLVDFPEMPDVEETGTTLEENSLLKARTIAEYTSLPSLADDSGLFVDALGGDPGVYSARWAGQHGDDAANTAKVLQQMAELRSTLTADVFTPRAAFRTVVTLVIPAGYRGRSEEEVIVERGEMVGELIESPRGRNGFGYDPIFIPEGFALTSAELSPEEKDAISHRGKAMRAIAVLIGERLSAR